MFQSLSDKLQSAFRRLRGKGKLSEADVAEAMREVRLALLESDVNFKVVKDFVKKVQERSVGQGILESLTPAQQVIKIVHEELVSLMGSEVSRLTLASRPPSIIMLVGLQGSGKTTTCGKLAKMLHKQGRRPLLVAADIYRPAAIKQLQIIGESIAMPVFSMGQQNPVAISKAALEYAHSHTNDVVIIDTAGRLHINQELMDELKGIKAAVQPHQILLVVDAMTGQDAVNVAQSFHAELELDGVILTKLDGDTRGGAALSIRAVTACPIKLVGLGEKLDALEPFYPDRMASRILGMGDILSLIEKAQANVDQAKAQEMEKKIRTQGFSLEDFLDQLQQVKTMGPIDQLLSMIPGFSNSKQLRELQKDVDPSELTTIEAIIRSMTPAERRNPSIINGSRRKRIARGSGTKVQDVNRLLKQFEETKKMVRQFTELGQGKNKKLKLPLFS